MSGRLTIRALDGAERDWLAEQLSAVWGSTTIVSAGGEHDAAQLAALVCCDGPARLGIATYAIEDGALEVVTLQSLVERAGAGSALIEALVGTAREHDCERLWLVTTNDNLDALRFYQRHGLRLVAVRAGAVDEARKRKPTIPLRGANGIPLHDELELELRLR
jgi:ribosomal protein S18 acetylase RimI-like enzyme